VGQGRDLEEFLERAPWMQKWVDECISCHHRGYKPSLPESQFDNSAVAITALRRLVDEMALDEAGVCEQCRRAAGKTPESSRPSSGLNCLRRKRKIKGCVHGRDEGDGGNRITTVC
jgi:hypothetical protein